MIQFYKELEENSNAKRFLQTPCQGGGGGTGTKSRVNGNCNRLMNVLARNRTQRGRRSSPAKSATSCLIAPIKKCRLTDSGSTLPRRQSLLPPLQISLAELGRNTARSYGTLPSKRVSRSISLFRLLPTVRRSRKWVCMK